MTVENPGGPFVFPRPEAGRGAESPLWRIDARSELSSVAMVAGAELASLESRGLVWGSSAPSFLDAQLDDLRLAAADAAARGEVLPALVFPDVRLRPAIFRRARASRLRVVFAEFEGRLFVRLAELPAEDLAGDDMWRDPVQLFLCGESEVTIERIRETLQVRPERWGVAEMKRVARILRRAGWRKVRMRSGERRVNVYRPFTSVARTASVRQQGLF